MAKSDKLQQVKYTNTYTLELDENEASVIMALVGAVGGQGIEREACGSIYQALKQVGMDTIVNPWTLEPGTVAQKMSAKLQGKPIHFREG